MPLPRVRWPVALTLVLAAACNDGPTPPNGRIAPGESFAVTGAQSVTLTPGADDAQYVAVVVNTGTAAGTSESYSLRGSGVSAPPAAMLLPGGRPSVLRAPLSLPHLEMAIFLDSNTRLSWQK